MINNLIGVVDKELLVQQLSFVDDASDVVDEDEAARVNPAYEAVEITDRNLVPAEGSEENAEPAEV